MMGFVFRGRIYKPKGFYRPEVEIYWNWEGENPLNIPIPHHFVVFFCNEELPLGHSIWKPCDDIDHCWCAGHFSIPIFLEPPALPLYQSPDIFNFEKVQSPYFAVPKIYYQAILIPPGTTKFYIEHENLKYETWSKWLSKLQELMQEKLRKIYDSPEFIKSYEEKSENSFSLPIESQQEKQYRKIDLGEKTGKEG